MKGYADFAIEFLGASAVATKPMDKTKFMDWNNTSGLIFANGKYYNGYVYGASCWATPIVDVDGKEIECWTYEETKEGSGKPDWLLNGDIHDEWELV